MNMLKGEEVTKYFEEHPEAVEALKGLKYQFKFPETHEPGEKIYRSVTVEDISFITFEGWEGQKGVFCLVLSARRSTLCKN